MGTRGDRVPRRHRLNPLLTDAHYGLGRSADGPSPLHERRVGISGVPRGRAARPHVAREGAGRNRPADLGGSRPDPRHDSPAARLGLRSRQLDQYVSTLLRNRSSLGLPYEPPAPVLLALGSAHFRNGDRVRAEYYWREATRVDDALGEAWNNLAAVYAATTRRVGGRRRRRSSRARRLRVNPRLKEEIAALRQQ